MEISGSRAFSSNLSSLHRPASRLDRALGERATARWGRWGNSETSWLAKNTFETWRRNVSKRGVVSMPPSNIAAWKERSLFVEERNMVDAAVVEEQRRRIKQLELQIERQSERKELKIELDADAIVAAVHEGMRSERREYKVEVDIDAMVSAVRASVQDEMRVARGGAEVSRLRTMIEELHLELKSTHSKVAHLCEQARPASPSAGAELTHLRKLDRDIQELRSELQNTHSQVVQLREEGQYHHRSPGHAAELSHLRSLEHAVEESGQALRISLFASMEESTSRLLEAVQDSERKGGSSEVLAAIRRIRSDDNQILDALQGLKTSLLDSIRGMRGDIVPVLDTFATNHRQLYESRPRETVVPQETMDHSELLRAVRSLQAQRDVVSMIQLAVEDNHRNLVDVVKSAKVDVLNALGSRDANAGTRDTSLMIDSLGSIGKQAQRIGEKCESNHQSLLSIKEALHLHPDTMHKRLEDHGRNMLSAIEAGMSRMDRGLPEQVCDATASNQEVIAAVQAANAEQREVLRAVHRLVSEVHEKPDVSELRQVIHASSSDAVQKIVAVIENAVDHSPLLEAIGSFELKGHSEVLAALRQMQIDLNMEPDFTPVLRAIAELQAPQAPASPANRKKYIVTLGGEAGVPTSVMEPDPMPVLRAMTEVPGVQKIQGMYAPYTWAATQRPASPMSYTRAAGVRPASPSRCVFPGVERVSPMSYQTLN